MKSIASISAIELFLRILFWALRENLHKEALYPKCENLTKLPTCMILSTLRQMSLLVSTKVVIRTQLCSCRANKRVETSITLMTTRTTNLRLMRSKDRLARKQINCNLT